MDNWQQNTIIHTPKHLSIFMAKRTTILLDRKIYEELVSESVKKYGDARHISKVINDRLSSGRTSKAKLVKLAKGRKYAEISNREFEEFRSELSKRLDS